MDSDKKFNYKSFLLPAVFVVLLILTVIFHKQAYSQDKEALGEEVFVDVLEMKTNSSGLNPGGLNVTVSYQGRTSRLRGVPSSAQFVMENSMTYHRSVSAKLYDGKLYYDSASIFLLSDQLYYGALAATFFVFILMFAELKKKLQG